MAKKHAKLVKAHGAQLRSRTTRSSRGRLVLSDPAESSHLLSSQLSSLGLYAASTVGDGNCLFRALSDQLYGTESRHAHLRKDVCDWITDHKSRYAPFVEDERGLEVHLRCMRENATYGGHLELSAFSHLFKRNVKVIQPGLVYVIEWDAGGETSTDEESRSRRRSSASARKYPTFPLEEGAEPLTVYVAYHDWEHFSSIRNLRGPHSGLPLVSEAPAPDDNPAEPTPPKPSSPKVVSKSTATKKYPKVKLKLSSQQQLQQQQPSHRIPQPLPTLLPPISSPAEDIPLPVSRSPSPAVSTLSGRDAASSSSASSATSPPPSSEHGRQLRSLPPAKASSLVIPARLHRSPKRSIYESDEGATGGGTSSLSEEGPSSKRSRRTIAQESPEEKKKRKSPSPVSSLTESDDDDDERMEDEDEYGGTPALTTASSLSSDNIDDEDDDDEQQQQPYGNHDHDDQHDNDQKNRTLRGGKSLLSKDQMGTTTPKRLTRRQRKALGLPKPRPSAGTIRIPGGRYRSSKSAVGQQEAGVGGGIGGTGQSSIEEWQKNGIGRVDVRGFRELKI